MLTRAIKLALGALEHAGLARREDAAGAQWNRTAVRHRETAAVVAQIAPGRGARILDVGCGRGGLARALAQAGFGTIEGCDMLPEGEGGGGALDYRRVDLDMDFLAGYPDAVYDIVVCSEVLEHLENPARMLREMARVLRPDGRIVITLPNAFNVFERAALALTGNSRRYAIERAQEHGHISMLPRNVLVSLARRARLKIVAIHPGYMFLGTHFVRPGRRAGPLLSYCVMLELHPQASPAADLWRAR